MIPKVLCRTNTTTLANMAMIDYTLVGFATLRAVLLKLRIALYVQIVHLP